MRKAFLTIGVLGLGFFAAALLGQGAPPKAAKTEPPSAAARLAAAERVCQMLHDEANGRPQGHQGVEHTYLWSIRRMEAQRDVDAARGDRFSALETHLQRMRDFQARIAELYKVGAASRFDLASTQYYVAEAEELLARERAK